MEFVIATVISFLVSEFPQFFSFFFFSFGSLSVYLFVYIAVVVVGVVVTISVTGSSCPLFTCVTFSLCIVRKVGLEWRCWRCVFYRRCNLLRAGAGHTNALQYRDVLVLTGDDGRLQDDVTDDAGRVTSPASGFVRGLRGAGMPVCVLEGSDRVGGRHRVGGSGNDRASDSDMTSDSDSGRVVDRAGWERRVADVAVSRTDRVTVAECGCVQGLERRVVVCLGDWRWRFRGSGPYFSLSAFSRCTTQLIRVNPPHSDDTGTDSSDSTHLTHTHTPHSTDDEDETTEDI